jgi:hypothetical protein
MALEGFARRFGVVEPLERSSLALHLEDDDCTVDAHPERPIFVLECRARCIYKKLQNS